MPDERREAAPSEAAIEAGRDALEAREFVPEYPEETATVVLHAARAAGAIRYDYEWDEAIAHIKALVGGERPVHPLSPAGAARRATARAFLASQEGNEDG